MSFNSSNLVSPDKDIKKAKEALLDNVRAIIQYNMSTSTAKDEKTLKEGIEYLKFVEKDLTYKLEMIKQYKELQSVNKTKLTVNNRLMQTATMESLKPIMNDIGTKDEIFFSELLAESRKLYGFLDKALTNYKQQHQNNSKKNRTKNSGNGGNKKSNKNSGNGSKSKTQKNNSRPSRAAAAAAEANANTPLKHQLKSIAKQTVAFINDFISFYGDEDNLKPDDYGTPHDYIFEYKYQGNEGIIPMSVQTIAGDGACGIRAFLTGVMYIVSKDKIILPINPPNMNTFIEQIKLIMLNFLLFLDQISDNKAFLRSSIYGNSYNLTEDQIKAKYILTHDEYSRKLLKPSYEFTIEELEVMCTLFNQAAPNVYQINVFSKNIDFDTVYDAKSVQKNIEFPSNKHINILYGHGVDLDNKPTLKHGHYDFIVDLEIPDELKYERENFFRLTLS
jgi:hypothetical protein